ncbi:sel1 repeat family protein [Polynucleobacter sp. AP-Jannik-300A-C4]|uniref:tetratricopeptide repeat protein n=1 Tax=Polynucleobacter sp. AP-Jannik-300A-C4 TaxID=2576928 RepID=UPI001BFE25FA|nr:tetratricopeptide repeat protein [Polynucleobacter sp. AP-Jannik-300A-C4]QWE22258.1 sel1 repeat family protein [Polynucleobacter sp. AP-Jannik-300A-C4]
MNLETTSSSDSYNNFTHPMLEIAVSNLNRGRYEAAFDIFWDLAYNELDAEAQFALTKMCFDGHLDAQQIEKLFDWVNSNSSLGNGYALFNVALMHERGMGSIKRDMKVAVEYYEKAIREEILDAYCNLGNIYVVGTGEDQGIKKNIRRGVELLTVGANEGSRQSAYNLGVLYEKGEHVQQDHHKAFYFLTLATLLRHQHAHRCLIIMQHAIKKDFTKEFDAAEQQWRKIENLRTMYRVL